MYIYRSYGPETYKQIRYNTEQTELCTAHACCCPHIIECITSCCHAWAYHSVSVSSVHCKNIDLAFLCDVSCQYSYISYTKRLWRQRTASGDWRLFKTVHFSVGSLVFLGKKWCKRLPSIFISTFVDKEWQSHFTCETG